MKPDRIVVVVALAALAVGCAHASSGQATGKLGHLNFAPYSKEEQNLIRSLKPTGDWIPVNVTRNLLILREHGIRLLEGSYSVQFLSDSTGNIPRFVLAKNRNVKLSDIDFSTGKASDGSFAEVLNFVSAVTMGHPYDETRAYLSGSGESTAIWAHLANERTERRGELFGWDNFEGRTQR